MSRRLRSHDGGISHLGELSTKCREIDDQRAHGRRIRKTRANRLAYGRPSTRDHRYPLPEEHEGTEVVGEERRAAQKRERDPIAQAVPAEHLMVDRRGKSRKAECQSVMIDLLRQMHVIGRERDDYRGHEGRGFTRGRPGPGPDRQHRQCPSNHGRQPEREVTAFAGPAHPGIEQHRIERRVVYVDQLQRFVEAEDGEAGPEIGGWDVEEARQLVAFCPDGADDLVDPEILRRGAIEACPQAERHDRGDDGTTPDLPRRLLDRARVAFSVDLRAGLRFFESAHRRSQLRSSIGPSSNREGRSHGSNRRLTIHGASHHLSRRGDASRRALYSCHSPGRPASSIRADFSSLKPASELWLQKSWAKAAPSSVRRMRKRISRTEEARKGRTWRSSCGSEQSAWKVMLPAPLPIRRSPTGDACRAGSRRRTPRRINARSTCLPAFRIGAGSRDRSTSRTGLRGAG